MQKGAIISLLFAIIGLLILFDFLILPINIKSINSPKEINLLEVNQKVQFQSIVISEKISGSSLKLTLNNNFSFKTDSKNISYLNKSIIVNGIITSFYNNKTLSVTSIKLK